MKSCPQCHLLLDQMSWEGPEAWGCGTCGGVWMPAESAPPLLADRGLLRELSRTYGVTGSTASFEGLPRSCPQCRIVQIAAVPADLPGRPEMAVCPRCSGCWIDAAALSEFAGPEPPATIPASVHVEPEAAAPEPEPDPTGAQVPEAEPVAVEAGPPTEIAAKQVVPVAPEPVAPPPSVAPPPQEQVGPIFLHGTDQHHLPGPMAAHVSPDPVILPPTPPAARPRPAIPVVEGPAPGSPLERLLDGNRRYVDGRWSAPHRDAARREEVAHHQHPFAVVVACADSRVPPEILFDVGIGDIFVIRTAGSVLGIESDLSIAYAVVELKVKLVLVMGHSRCGAMRAAVEGAVGHEYLRPLADVVRQAVAASQSAPGDRADSTARAWTRMTVQRLRTQARTIAEYARRGEVSIVGAYYDLDTGEVEVIDDADGATEPAAAADAGSRLPVRPQAPGDLDAQEAQPEMPWERHAHRWCPQCRQGFETDRSFCTLCGIGLVDGRYLARCLQCRAENPISSVRCSQCGADMHPEWLTRHQAPGVAQGHVDPPLQGIPTSTSARPADRSPSSCTTSILAALGTLFAIGTLVLALHAR